MVRQEEALAAKPENLSLVPETYMIKENRLLRAVLSPPDEHRSTCGCSYSRSCSFVNVCVCVCMHDTQVDKEGGVKSFSEVAMPCDVPTGGVDTFSFVASPAS